MHLEATSNLLTETFLTAFNRFVSRTSTLGGLLPGLLVHPLDHIDSTKRHSRYHRPTSLKPSMSLTTLVLHRSPRVLPTASILMHIGSTEYDTRASMARAFHLETLSVGNDEVCIRRFYSVQNDARLQAGSILESWQQSSPPHFDNSNRSENQRKVLPRLIGGRTVRSSVNYSRRSRSWRLFGHYAGGKFAEYRGSTGRAEYGLRVDSFRGVPRLILSSTAHPLASVLLQQVARLAGRLCENVSLRLNIY